MQIITHIFRGFAFMGVCAWVLAWLISTLLNFRFGWIAAGGTSAGLLFALLLLCLGISKAGLQLTIIQELRAGKEAYFLIRFLYALAILSFYIATSNILALRVQGSALNDQAMTEYSASQKLKQELQALGSPRSKDELSNELEKVTRSNLWKKTDECSNTTKAQGFCERYFALTREVARRDRYEAITQEIEGLPQEKAVSDQDPLTSMIAGLMRTQKAYVYVFMAVIVAALVEIWSSFGLLWMGRAFGQDLLIYTPAPKPDGPKMIDVKAVEVKRLGAPSDADSLIDAFFKTETEVADLAKVEDIMEAATLFADLYPAYQDYCKSQGADPLGDAAFSERASKKGHYKRHKQGGEAYCVGVRLRRKKS